jgi:hypothetical protein
VGIPWVNGSARRRAAPDPSAVTSHIPENFSKVVRRHYGQCAAAARPKDDDDDDDEDEEDEEDEDEEPAQRTRRRRI